MARNTKFALRNILLFSKETNRHVKQPHYFMSQFAAVRTTEYENPIREQVACFVSSPMSNTITTTNRGKTTTGMDVHWAPHPRTGIYIPTGHDSVMDDVPDNAGSLGQGQIYWLRNDIGNGAEGHHPDIPSADHYLIA